jgi:two-component system, OmpR family, heavy metal sensor histidine kinase CusS
MTAAQRAVEDHAARSFVWVAALRLAALSAFLLLCELQTMLGAPGWAQSLAPLCGALGLSVVVFMVRHHPRLKPLGAYSFVFDVLLVFELQRRSLSDSPFPAGVAGFSLGLFAVLVTLCASAMSRVPTFVTAAVAAVAELELMNLAGVGLGAMVAAVLVLLVLAVSQSFFAHALKRLVVSLASSEVAIQLKSRQVSDLEDARRTIERMLTEAEARHRQLSTLQQDKDLLTALIVHDLRAPLGAIRANADFVKSELASDCEPDLRDAVNDVLTVTDRMAGMITDLLNISRLETNSLPINREPVPVDQLITTLSRQLAAQARARSIALVVKADHTSLDADVALLTRTLENLASNALRYTPTGGRICLEVRASGDDVLVAVRNDGPPIPLGARAQLFDKFVQGGTGQENRRAGWGLGLYFCRLCINAHGGRICIEDEPGWSTSFVVHLPVAVDREQRRAA